MANNENIPNDDRQESNSPAVPFFVRYLERQFEDLSDEESESIGGSMCDIPTTRKYPSDNEDGSEIVTTQKYPSDHEEGLEITTLKYPSDNEEGAEITTLKFPSDNEDS
ncbi:MAG: microviridin/marinostatin family tricyclic proteinase inhibitor [Xenococcus sp. (in: cyanobacteria)]